MKIAVGSDHAGFEEPKPYYKPEIIHFIEEAGHEVLDCGPAEPGAVDYPDHAARVCAAILNKEADRGVLICGSGIGMSMTANRYDGIRAALCTNTEMAQLARLHNDANVVCLGSRILTLDEIYAILDAWLETEFSGEERHRRRVEKLGKDL